MPEGFARHLVNPDTGWAACWRSRDGALHDYASPFINGPACAFGIPFTLRPMDPADHMIPALMGGGKTEPTFECYTDGSMGPSAAAFYLRALSIHGFRDRAAHIAAALDAGFADGLFTGPPGGLGDGREFLSWEGLSSGYEGSFGPSFSALYAVAIAQGALEPPDPEWWPANG